MPHKASVDVGGVRSPMSTHLLKIHLVQSVIEGFDLIQPFSEAQETHPAAGIAVMVKTLCAGVDMSVCGNSPARGRAEVKGEDGGH